APGPASPVRLSAAETVRRWRILWRTVRPVGDTPAAWSVAGAALDNAPAALAACPLDSLPKQHLVVDGSGQRHLCHGEMRIVFQIQFGRTPLQGTQQQMLHGIEGDGGKALGCPERGGLLRKRKRLKPCRTLHEVPRAPFRLPAFSLPPHPPHLPRQLP